MKTFLISLLVTLVVVFVFAVSCCSAQCQYVVTDLGALGGSYQSRAFGINNSGQVVGFSSIDNGPVCAFLYSNGAMQDLGITGGPNYAFDINDSSQIVGGCYGIGIPNRPKAFLYANGITQELGLLNGPSYAVSINNGGQIVGSSRFDYPINHAFLYSNGVMQDIGLSCEGPSMAYGINDHCQIVGIANGSPFLWQSNTGMQDLGTLGGQGGAAFSINNSGQIVGYAATSSDNNHAFLYQGGAKQDLGVLASGNTSRAFGINNKGQVVGSSNYASESPQHAFVCNSGGQMQDLNNLISPVSEWTLFEARSINDNGQIVGTGVHSGVGTRAFLLTPVGNCQSYQVQQPVCAPIERLAKWDGSNWVPVIAGELSSAKVHVLVHGWGPGLKTFTENGGKIWDEKDPVTGETNQACADYTNLAQSIKHANPDSVVVLFNWIDMSATEDPGINPFLMSKYAKQSKLGTDTAALDLVAALKSACDFAGLQNGETHLFGHSHGARVAAKATEILYNKGNIGSVVIDHLTLGDSPEVGLQSGGGYNYLDSIMPNINIGRSAGNTFVDNYYSCLGRGYAINQGVVNVQLDPNPNLFLNDKHGYPLDWYTGANFFANDVALAWSPLAGDAYQTLSSSYEQDWIDSEGNIDWSREYVLKGIDPTSVLTKSRVEMSLITLLTNGFVTGLVNGLLLEEHSSAYWHAGFTKNQNDIALEFTYQFLEAGDGDQLGIWIDDELRFIITGNLAGTNSFTSDIDISDLSAGDHILSVALHSYGDAGCSVNVTDFTMISVPEPSALVLLTIATFVGLAGFIFRQKVA